MMNYTQFYLFCSRFFYLIDYSIEELFIIFAEVVTRKGMANKNINRIKVMLAEKGRTNKWLAEQIGKDPATISKWCTNASQPSLEVLLQVAKILEVEIKDLIREQND